MTAFTFTKTDKINETQKNEFYDYSVTDLETYRMFWTDDLAEAKAAAESVGLAMIWDTNENEEVK